MADEQLLLDALNIKIDLINEIEQKLLFGVNPIKLKCKDEDNYDDS